MFLLSAIIVGLTVLAVLTAILLKSRYEKIISILGIINVVVATVIYFYLDKSLPAGGCSGHPNTGCNSAIGIYFLNALVAVLVCGTILLLAFKRQDGVIQNSALERSVRTSAGILLFGVIAIVSFIFMALANI